MKKLFLVLLFIGTIISSSEAQRSDHLPGQFIIWTSQTKHIQSILADYQLVNGFPTQLHVAKELVPGFPIYLLKMDQATFHEGILLQLLRNDTRVTHAQYNHLITPRSVIPDDPLFQEQWNFMNPGIPQGSADIDMDLAWDVTTGGTLYDGHPIVVAVIDDGIDPYHPDLAPNLWYNTDEIPFNGQDDDQNGYIDDYAGWNVSAGFDLVQYGVHGIQVAGLIGAKGNNTEGISGVNWDVDIMPIVGISGIESEVVEAYGYALNERLRFQLSGGTEGSLVVCTNTSFGVDFGDPQDYPIWCAMFDLLGQNGILSVAATINSDVDVDSANDMPTSCGSPYLITVTATDADDQRNFSGYGITTVDLAAPGEDILTTELNSSYGLATGTSFAAPQVAGLVALLYAAPCEQIALLTHNQPDEIASLIKEAILTGVDEVDTFSDELVTGGRLNAFNAMQEVLNICDVCLPPAGMQAVPVSDSSVNLTWINLPGTELTTLQWKEIDSMEWNVVLSSEPPFLLDGLSSCTKYQFRLKSSCTDINSGFSPSTAFTTLGCCEIPAGFEVEELAGQTALLAWEDVYGSQMYLFRYRETGTDDWTNQQISQTSIFLEELNECGSYEAEVIAKCGQDQFSVPASQEFSLPGCNNCQEQEYCSVDFYSSLEWIESFTFNTQVFQTGNNNGYLELTDTGLEIISGSTIPFEVVPGFDNWTYYESYLIWVDLDQDGEFSVSAGELLYSSEDATDSLEAGLLSFPIGIQTGITRMRVMQVYTGPYGLVFPFSCTAFGEYGEVEDYCLTIIDSGITNPPCDSNLTIQVSETELESAQINWTSSGTSSTFSLRYRNVLDSIWTELTIQDTNFLLANLVSCQTYEVQIASWCDTEFSEYSPSVYFETECILTSIDLTTIDQQPTVSPNPFSGETTFFGKANSDYRFELYSSDGKMLYTWTYSTPSSGVMNIPADRLIAAGFYFLRWSDGSQTSTLRLLKL